MRHIIVSVIFCLVYWRFVSTQVITECALFHFDAKWDYANWLCRNRTKTLLCYKSKEEIQRIINWFYPYSIFKENVRIWLSRRDCTDWESESRCLSLLVNRNETHQWHSFQQHCSPASFICCSFRRELTTFSSTTWESTSELTTEATSAVLTTSTTTGITTGTSTTNTPFVSSQTSTELTAKPTEFLTCPSVLKRGVLWPVTVAGESIILPCPGSSIGNASWTCNKEGSWLSKPNMSFCHSTQLLTIKDNFERDSADKVVTSLRDLFDDIESIQGNDLRDSVSLLSLLPEKMQQDCEAAPDEDCWTVAEGMIKKATSVVSRMVELDTWEDITMTEVTKAGSEMLSACDRFGFFLANTMHDVTYSVVDTNIAIEASRHNDSHVPVSLPRDLSEHSRGGQILLDIQHSNPQVRPLSIVYIYYSNMNKILIAQKSGSLNSAVVSTSVSQGGLRSLSVKGKVHVLVEHLHTDRNDSACVFWNMKKHHWDPKGCRLHSSNSSHSLCVCDHLTNFAVLMDYKGLLLDINEQALFVITVVGCSISLVALAICIIVFTCYRWQKGSTLGVRYSIHRNLCITLFLGNIILIAGFNRTDNPLTCAIIAGLLHYFFLSAFSWMLLEGVHIYILLVIVFASKKTHWKKYYLFGYGFPLVIVGITAAVTPSSYGTDEVCWLSVNNGSVWSFTGPVAFILVMNSAALVLAQFKASRISTKDQTVAIIKRWLRVTFILFPILGLTWILGFLYIGKDFIVVAYIFAILNSLQGFCIFICHFLMDKRSRNMVVNAIRKKLPSIDTESTGTNKRSRRDTKGLLRSGSSSSSSKKMRQHTWWRPWSFMATLNLTKNETVPSVSQKCSSEDPEVLHWKKVYDSAVL